MKESKKFELDKKNNDLTHKLTKEDEEILFNYTKGLYNTINIDLRNGKELKLESIKGLDSVLEKETIKKNTVLYRTANINELGLNVDEEKIWDKLDIKTKAEYGTKEYYKEQYDIYSRQNKENYNNWKDNLKIGDEIEDRAFKSTSTDINIVKNFQNIYINEEYGRIPSPTQVLIKYNLTKDLNGATIGEKSYVSNQKEVLLERNTKSKIKKIDFNNKYGIMEIEMDLYK